ncbi:MAG TPA: permease-like cell division protein FtsX [Patescibacteria group bacterium]|nr:permease-like cell division protein FtsX [Patescibacteria group bacterium]
MYLKTALSNIRRSPFQGVAAILVLTVTFFVATIFSILIYSSAQVLNYFETKPQIIVFLKTDAKDTDVNALQTKLGNDSRIRDLKYVSKEDALTIYKNATSDNPLLGQLVSPSIFPASLEFSVKDLSDAQNIINSVKKEPTVDSVSFTAAIGGESASSVISRLTKITFYIRVGGLVLAFVLAFTSFLVLMVIVSMRIATKKGEIDTLRIMGATSSFIRTPIMLEAIIYVTIGVILGWVLALILILYVSPAIISYFAQIPVLPHNTQQFFELNLVVFGGELLIGFIIAFLGGFTAVTRALSK